MCHHSSNACIINLSPLRAPSVCVWRRRRYRCCPRGQMRLSSIAMASATFILVVALSASLPVESQVVEEPASLSAASLMADARDMASELGFGKAMLKHFTIDKEYINLNHGRIASGTFCRVPSCILLDKSVRDSIPVMPVRDRTLTQARMGPLQSTCRQRQQLGGRRWRGTLMCSLAPAKPILLHDTKCGETRTRIEGCTDAPPLISHRCG